ncbi:MAG: threonylcarbamoyl-AMP synthase, partial [Phycisphaerales bacterium]|nr:threonylcarbamoyl-AMP synthase [Phycisphaerales bacterium]
MSQAVAALRAGGIVAFPTETVYGLGACTLNPDAIERVYRLKGRPADNPLIAHVGDAGQARQLVERWDERADRLAHRFWPGPLALVLARRASVPAIAAGGRDTLAVRAPGHPVALELLRRLGAAISAPSANRSGRVSPTTAQHVAEEFPDADELLILDGGPCTVGVESTVLDLTVEPPRVLRPGAVTAEMLSRTIGAVDAARVKAQAHAPGTSAAHYAPQTPARIVDTAALADAFHDLQGRAAILAWTRTEVPPPHRTLVMPDDAAAYATRLYAALREA